MTSAAAFVVFLDATVVNIAFPAISADFPQVTRAGMSWVLNSYSIAFGALLVTAGRLADERGRRRVFLSGLAVFALASAACGLAPSVPALIIARSVQAVGAALLVPASLALLLPEFPPARRATAVGLWGAVAAVAAAVGPSVGALLIEGPGWRWIFYVNVPFCVLAGVAGLWALRESRSPQTVSGFDGVGVLLVSAVFGLLSLGIVQGQSWGWLSPGIVGSLTLAAALTPALVFWSRRHRSPVLPVSLFRVRSFTIASAGMLLFSAAFFANVLCNVVFLTGVWHYSVLRTAVAVLPGPALASVLAPLAGRLADRAGHRAVILPGTVCFTAGQMWFVRGVTATPAYLTDLLPGLILVGVGIGLALPTLNAAGTQALPPPDFGVGAAVISAARQLGAVLGVAGLIALLGQPSPATVTHVFHRAWAVIGLAGAATAVTVLMLGRTVVASGQHHLRIVRTALPYQPRHLRTD